MGTEDDADSNGIMQGLREAADIAAGRADPATYRVHVTERVDVRAIRKKPGLKQDGFAARFAFSPAAMRDWEQDRRQPEAAARVLLKAIDREPEAVDQALAG